MISKIALSRSQIKPIALRYTDVRSYIILSAFVLLSVAVPWAFHRVNLAGATFLPMHFFVLVAGLILGWRAGLIVGVVTPLASYAVSGMPVWSIIPQTVLELSAYGLIAGILREKCHIRVVWSLAGAMAGGRLVLFLMMLVWYLILGQVRSPLGVESSPFTALWSVIKQGYPGIITQLLVIPFLVLAIERIGRRK